MARAKRGAVSKSIEITQAGNIPISNPEGIKPVYSNSAAIYVGQYDVRLVFSEFVPLSANNPVSLELRSNVVLSPGHAKQFLQALSSSISQYETNFGEIKCPPESK